MAQNILPQMVDISRDCGHTQHLHNILKTKLSETDMHTLIAWIGVVKEERAIAINDASKKLRYY